MTALKDYLFYVDESIRLLRFEIEKQESCSPLTKVITTDQFEPGIYDPNYVLAEPQLTMIKHCEEDWKKEGVETFMLLGALAYQEFPELSTLSGGSSREQTKHIFEKIKDADFIKRIFERVSIPGKPSTNQIDETWALFRQLQIALLYSIEYTRKFGARKLQWTAKRFGNDVIDTEYLLAGTLAGALATKDKELKRFFRLCHATGTLYT